MNNDQIEVVNSLDKVKPFEEEANLECSDYQSVT